MNKSASSLIMFVFLKLQ